MGSVAALSKPVSTIKIIIKNQVKSRLAHISYTYGAVEQGLCVPCLPQIKSDLNNLSFMTGRVVEYTLPLLWSESICVWLRLVRLCEWGCVPES